MEPQEQNPIIWNKISRNVLSNLAGTAIAIVVGFFLMPFVVHRIGLTEFGIWILTTSLVGYMGLLDVGLAPTLVKKSAEHLAKDDKQELNKTVNTIFILYLLSGAVFGVTIFALSFFVSHVFKVPLEDINTFKIVLWLVGLQAAIRFPMSIWQGLMGGLQDFHIINGIVIITNMLRAAGTVILLVSGFGLISLIWLEFALNAIGWLASMFWVRRRIPHLSIKISGFDLAKVKDLVRFSLAMFISGIAGKTIHGADRIIIGLFLPVASITIYEVGARISDYSRSFLYSVLSAIIPATSALNTRDEKMKLQELYLNGTKYLLIAFGMVVGALFLFGKEFIHLWMGKGFEESVWIMYALIIGNLYQSQNVVAHATLIGMGKLRMFTKVMVAYPIVNIILSIIFVTQWGLIGVALATMMTFVIIETYFIFYITKVFDIKFFSLLRACHLRAAISVVPAIGIIYYLASVLNVNSWAGLSLGIIVFLMSALFSFLVFGISKYERSILRSRVYGTFRFNQR